MCRGDCPGRCRSEVESQGQAGYITQALGGQLYGLPSKAPLPDRGRERDAIGKEAVKAPELPPQCDEEDVKKLVWEQMRTCFDRNPINIVDLGLVYDCNVTANPDGTRT